jgi:hypothetical protein
VERRAFGFAPEILGGYTERLWIRWSEKQPQN